MARRLLDAGSHVSPFRNRSDRLIIDGKPLVDDHFSGVGHYTMSLVGALDEVLVDRPDLDVRIVVPRDRTARVHEMGLRRIRPLRLPVPYLAFRRAVEQGTLPTMDRLLGRGTYFFPNYIRWPLHRSPSVTAVHDLSFVKVPETVDGPNAQLLRREVRNSVEHSDAITALTETMADEIAEHYDLQRGRIHVVGAAADQRHFYRRSDREIAEVKATYGIYGDYLITVGNIEPRKNQIRLIDAFCSLPRALADRYTLILVGAGAWNERAIHARVDEALASGHKVMALLSTVSDRDLPALYSGASASTYTSIYEGFGMPPLEAMACQTPVLTGDRSTMPEVAGGAAILVDVTDTDAIAKGLEGILGLDDAARADLVARGLENVDRYRWETAAQHLLGAVDAVAVSR